MPSFVVRKGHTIEAGDVVIVYNSPESMSAVVVAEEGRLENRFGIFPYKEMIGKPWGWQMYSTDSRGFVYLLHPTPELWTLALPHRTQILYMPDISLILSMLEIRAGTVVVESGTGSGSFSHSLARSVGSSGHLYTFEYHAERAERARMEFLEHGLENRITVASRDVCKDGFDLQDMADAVFLDLPAPWEAVGHAKVTFKRKAIGRICCFSPCIEQVQKTCSALHQHGFRDMRLIECLVRPHEIRPMKLLAPPGASSADMQLGNGQMQHVSSRPLTEVRGHTSFLTFAILPPLDAEARASE